MEMQGTVKPPVVQNEYFPYGFFPPGPPPPLSPYIVTFGATRSAYGCEWGLRSSDSQWETATNSNGIAGPQYVWSNDDLGGGLDLTVSTGSHIYYSDTPGWGDNSTTKYKEVLQVTDFVNFFKVNLYGSPYIASDAAKWHTMTRVVTNPADTTKLIRGDAADQKLGDGWIDIPLTP
jgi:hypothetical protein